MFENYGIQLRVIDYTYNCIARRDPEVRSHHYKALYCMIKGDHIYTFNYDIKSLQQLHLEKKTKQKLYCRLVLIIIQEKSKKYKHIK